MRKGSKAKVYCSNKILRHNILVAIGVMFNLYKKKRVKFFYFSKSRNLVTYNLMETFLWNHMKAKILEDEK